MIRLSSTIFVLIWFFTGHSEVSAYNISAIDGLLPDYNIFIYDSAFDVFNYNGTRLGLAGIVGNIAVVGLAVYLLGFLPEGAFGLNEGQNRRTSDPAMNDYYDYEEYEENFINKRSGPIFGEESFRSVNTASLSTFSKLETLLNILKYPLERMFRAYASVYRFYEKFWRKKLYPGSSTSTSYSSPPAYSSPPSYSKKRGEGGVEKRKGVTIRQRSKKNEKESSSSSSLPQQSPKRRRYY